MEEPPFLKPRKPLPGWDQIIDSKTAPGNLFFTAKTSVFSGKRLNRPEQVPITLSQVPGQLRESGLRRRCTYRAGFQPLDSCLASITQPAGLGWYSIAPLALLDHRGLVAILGELARENATACRSCDCPGQAPIPLSLVASPFSLAARPLAPSPSFLFPIL